MNECDHIYSNSTLTRWWLQVYVTVERWEAAKAVCTSTWRDGPGPPECKSSGMRLIVVGCRRSMIPTLCCCVHYCIGINRSAVNNESSGTPSHHSAAATADGNVIALIWSVGPAKRNLYVLLVLPLSAHVVCVEEEIPGHILWLYTQPTERQYSLTNIIRSHRSLGWNGTWSSFQSAVECGSVSTVDTLSPGKIQ